jgi:hypothetical protein
MGVRLADRVTTPEKARAHVRRILYEQVRPRPFDLLMYADKAKQKGLLDIAEVYQEAHDSWVGKESPPISEQDKVVLRALGKRRLALCVGSRLRVQGYDAICVRFAALGNPVIRDPDGHEVEVQFELVEILHKGKWI